MSKSKKRWETSQAIRREIEAERQRANDIRAEAVKHEATFKEAIKRPPPWSEDYHNMVAWEKKQAVKKFKQAERIESATIPKLSEKIAEFETNMLPCCDDGDRSVPRRLCKSET